MQVTFVNKIMSANFMTYTRSKNNIKLSFTFHNKNKTRQPVHTWNLYMHINLTQTGKKTYAETGIMCFFVYISHVRTTRGFREAGRGKRREHGDGERCDTEYKKRI